MNDRTLMTVLVVGFVVLVLCMVANVVLSATGVICPCP